MFHLFIKKRLSIYRFYFLWRVYKYKNHFSKNLSVRYQYFCSSNNFISQTMSCRTFSFSYLSFIFCLFYPFFGFLAFYFSSYLCFDFLFFILTLMIMRRRMKLIFFWRTLMRNLMMMTGFFFLFFLFSFFLNFFSYIIFSAILLRLWHIWIIFFFIYRVIFWSIYW